MEALQPVVVLEILALLVPVIVEAMQHVVDQQLLALLVPAIVEALQHVVEIPILALLTSVSVVLPPLVEAQIPFQISVRAVRVNVGRLQNVHQRMFYINV